MAAEPRRGSRRRASSSAARSCWSCSAWAPGVVARPATSRRSCTGSRGVLEAADREPEQADALARRRWRRAGPGRQLVDRRVIVDPERQRVRAGPGSGSHGSLTLTRHGPAPATRFVEGRGDRRGLSAEPLAQEPDVAQVLDEGLLVADRLRRLVGLRPVADPRLGPAPPGHGPGPGPRWRTSSSGSSCASSATRSMPSRSSVSRWPGRPRRARPRRARRGRRADLIGHDHDHAGPGLAPDRRRWLGFARFEASLAISFDGPTPTAQSERELLGDPRPDRVRDAGGLPERARSRRVTSKNASSRPAARPAG